MWPSLIALVGTVAVVVVLLVAFGDRVDDAGSNDEAAGGEVVDDAPATDAAPTEGAPTDSAPSEGTDSGDESGEPDPEPSPSTADPEDREPVGVLNASSVDGLEVDAQELFVDGGWEVPATATYDGTLDVTTVFYPEGMEEAAEALRSQFPAILEVEPTIEGLNASRLVVIVADDFAAAVGESD